MTTLYLNCVFHFVNQESWDPELSYPPFPFRVAKSLDPDFYRNAQFDIWLDQKKGNLIVVIINAIHRNFTLERF